VGFDEGLERAVRWYVDNQDWWRPLKSGDFWDFYRRNYKPLQSGAR
jgi:dTDP-glucose 4,6-dehydratase